MNNGFEDQKAGAWYPRLSLPRLRTYEASPRLGLYYGPWKPGCPGPALKQLAGRSAKGPVQFGAAKAGMAIAKAIAATTRATVKSMSMRCMFFTSSPFILRKENRPTSPLGGGGSRLRCWLNPSLASAHLRERVS